MKETVTVSGFTIEYELEYKNVRRMNLRIRPDGSIRVSAGKSVSKARVEQFVISKAAWIRRTQQVVLERNQRPQQPYFEESEICGVILEFCRQVYPYFQARGVAMPVVKFRKMVSCWGNCRAQKGILTFNKNLCLAPPACIDYVVKHEFTHFLQPNHSKAFYEELEKICPDWKQCRAQLKEIRLR